MKVGVVGVGRVGAACALSLVTRGSVREVVIVDRTRARAKAVGTDLRFGAPLCPEVALRDGDYSELAGADLVMLTAGVNEKSGGATDRNDPKGRLKLLGTNVGVYKDLVPKVAEAAGGGASRRQRPARSARRPGTPARRTRPRAFSPLAFLSVYQRHQLV
jgi:L-lactate dehydrogenase